MEEKERLKSILQELAGDFDAMADEYEKRIEEYEEALRSVNEAIEELEEEKDDNEEESESPDGVMTEILLEQDDFEDTMESALPDGLREGVEVDNASLKDAILGVQRMQDMRERMEDSMSDSDSENIRSSMVLCRELIETALIQTKADYAKLLRHIESIGSIWEFTE